MSPLERNLHTNFKWKGCYHFLSRTTCILILHACLLLQGPPKKIVQLPCKPSGQCVLLVVSDGRSSRTVRKTYSLCTGCHCHDWDILLALTHGPCMLKPGTGGVGHMKRMCVYCGVGIMLKTTRTCAVT